MEADHRHLCKFDSPNNSNYLILQRAFLTTIEELEADSELTKKPVFATTTVC
jgi:hypothetical protein